jgi:hypothetical protein
MGDAPRRKTAVKNGMLAARLMKVCNDRFLLCSKAGDARNDCGGARLAARLILQVS